MKTFSENRHARHDYNVLETFEAGISLTGHEAKSVKSGTMNLGGGYAVVRGEEVWLLNVQVPPFQPQNAPPDYDPSRTRRLLLHKGEIAKLIGALHEKGVSLIPLRAYERRGFIKIELGLARARKKKDKRELLKKTTAEREMRERKT